MNCKPFVNRLQKMVPEGGFEPPTRGFSILCLTNNIKQIFVNHAQNSPIGIKGLQKACKPKSRLSPSYQTLACTKDFRQKVCKNSPRKSVYAGVMSKLSLAVSQHLQEQTNDK